MARYFIAMPASALIAFLLFSFMAWMVDNGRTQKPEQASPLQFDMVMVENDTDVQRRQRSVPDQPETPPEPPTNELPKPTAASSLDASFDSPVAQLSMNTQIKGVAIQAPSIGKLTSQVSDNRQLMPIYRVQPNYPSRALRRNIEGYVVVRFDIDENGRPFNIQVVESKPSRMFDREAIRAVKRWKYQPNVENGTASVVTGQQTKVEFRIAK
ncbi:energy transducer TonB [Vibrio viridaestus]|uniref:Protein TonB n=1 Tax=Vibrio viridaestus TaxID=2487322 RepID=A0A3N9THS5_9VIBR|nr:energy transducer TonB [Vibrio viridaestus]RQW63600.1 energy transducer TonB [Vibrio viridaestus]